MHAQVSDLSGRVLDRPSGHDPAHKHYQLVFWTIHIANVESAHATTDRALVRGRAGGAFEWISEGLLHLQLVELQQKAGGDGSVDLAAKTTPRTVELAPAVMLRVMASSGRR
jgi:hypothetical protein